MTILPLVSRVAHCNTPFWSADDFTLCFTRDYLQTLLPLIPCAISLVLLSHQAWKTAASNQKVQDGYEVIKQRLRDSTGNGHGNGHSNGHGHGPSNPEMPDPPTEDSPEESENEEDLVLRPTISRGACSNLTTDEPTGEVTIALTEAFAVLVNVGIQVASLVLGEWSKRGTTASIAQVVVWAYIAILASMRLLVSSSDRLSMPILWYHTAFLYGYQWILTILVFRSAVIHPPSDLDEALTSTQFGLTTVLFAIVLASRKGNKAVELEYEGDIEPAREPLASVFALATFSWVDPIVWKGYCKTLEQIDVWNLLPRDKAAAILADYRQLKRTNVLAWHLLKYFKRELITQASWAAISGVVTFVPTILLKVILQYVEDPMATPKNAAWFYVMLLFVSGVCNALSSGQALWVGRKICIRLRAIIIGEIYAKALRRRAAASPDKILGQQDEKDGSEAKRGLFEKMMSFGRKKQKQKTTGEPGNADQKPTADSQVTSGAIINLMAVDSFKVADISAYLHFLWAETPVQFVLAIVLLYQILGASSIVGIGMMALLLPVNMVIAKRFASCQKKILAATDARIHTTNEVLTNVRIIKYFAWEQRFLGIVDEKRTTELKHLRSRYIVWAIAATIWSGAPIVITFLTFMVYTLVEQKDLVPSVAFTALSLFSLLRIPLDQLADMVAHVQESKVSVDRVEEYLNEPETPKYRQLQFKISHDTGEPVIGFEGATFSWGNRNTDDFKMMGLDIRFKVGQINVIVGPTGSGKSSMLMALLGEMTLLGGSVYLPGGKSREDLEPNPHTGVTESVAYCAQQAWLLNGTIKQNIVFHSKWDARRYKDVIVACSLQRDLEILDKGDQTLVGEKGVTLSGGQKQRISLARALYSSARHVLLDDVLSAVDSHTAKWIFDKALLGRLMYHRTCILVTHNAVLCLPHADFAVVLDNGRVAVHGPPGEVISSGKLAEDVSKFPSRPGSRSPSTLPSRVPSDIGRDASSREEVESPVVQRDRRESEAGLMAPGPNSVLTAEPLSKVVSKDIPGMNRAADDDALLERKATGSVKLAIITKYLKYMGGPSYWALAASCFALQQISQVATNVWIREWANAYAYREDRVGSGDAVQPLTITHFQGGVGGSFNCLRAGSCTWSLPFFKRSDRFDIASRVTEVNVPYYLGIYAVLGLVYMFISLAREGVLFAGSLTASKRVHRRLMESVTHAKFRFFDSTPLGQIMNRFSKDIESVDQEIAPVAVGVVHCLASIVTIVVLISVIMPYFLIAGFFITILYFLIGRFYISSSRDLKRLESVQRSPLYQQFGETLSGMTTIRAYGDERRFIRENLNRVNTHSRPFIYLWAANRWLAFRVDVVGALVSFFTGAFVVLSVGTVDAGAAGLAMTYAVTFTENVLWFVRLYASNEQNMNAVERIKEYLDVDQEAASIVEENRPEANWPSQGTVELIGYSTRYRSDFDLVLKNITFRIAPGEKVGVVGRTGAGKSSLALALFRALEAESGKILVDDVDIALIGLQDLRENIVMVPQDPTLFTGTIRSNLDPFGLFTDEEVYTALRRVQLVGTATSTVPSRAGSPTVSLEVPHESRSSPALSSTGNAPAMADSQELLENKNIFRNLSSTVSESGSNLSQGQRQLLCLARALLKNPKVLLMDEATASIDYATDAKIQETIREIRNTTITIAHRLQTIMDYDKVLVLDQGEVQEFASPWELLQREGGAFRAMCETSGERETLEREAKRAWERGRLVDDG